MKNCCCYRDRNLHRSVLSKDLALSNPTCNRTSLRNQCCVQLKHCSNCFRIYILPCKVCNSEINPSIAHSSSKLLRTHQVKTIQITQDYTFSHLFFWFSLCCYAEKAVCKAHHSHNTVPVSVPSTQQTSAAALGDTKPKASQQLGTLNAGLQQNSNKISKHTGHFSTAILIRVNETFSTALSL